MKKGIWGALATISFVVLTGSVGGFECGNMTMTQFVIASVVTLGVLGVSLSRLSKYEWDFDEED